jgi:hypothetical protein
MIDSTFLRQYEERGVTLHIDEGQTQTGNLAVIALP